MCSEMMYWKAERNKGHGRDDSRLVGGSIRVRWSRGRIRSGALAYVCKLYGKKSTVVLPRRRDRRLHADGCGEESRCLRGEVPPATETCREIERRSGVRGTYGEHNEEKHEGDVMELLPFGLHCDEFVSELVQRLKDCIPETLRLKDPPKRLWTVAGSAALLASFAKVWPSTKFMVVQVGKKIWPDQIGHTKREGDGEGEFIGPRTGGSFIARTIL